MNTIIRSLKPYIDQTILEFDQIIDQRRHLLYEIATEIQNTDQLTFICTHNLRRSHFSQVWAQTAAFYYQVYQIEAFSGGTSVTECNIRTINALQRAGFLVNKSHSQENPIYQVRYSEQSAAIKAFSKIYNTKNNPTEGFIGLMCCPEADQECPVIFGAKKRFPLHYIDPKFADGKLSETDTYDQCCRQISREMFFFIKQVKNRIEN
mgnify:CR=1 FL=1